MVKSLMEAKWRGLRVLPLLPWMRSRRSAETLEQYTEILPKFGRDGRYSLRGVFSWFEVRGRAYLEIDEESFSLDLLDQNHKQLTTIEIAALSAVVNLNIDPDITKKARKLLMNHYEKLGSRSLKIYLMRFRNKIKGKKYG